MATDKDFVNYVADQMEQAGEIRTRAMFGEYGIYCNDKFFALICDNKLFIKPTKAGRAFLGEVNEAPPYEGAKPSFLITEELEDRDKLAELVKVTITELPAPKPKKEK
ncbi:MULTISPECIES: TfoX/Sxy family protein [unclassified Lentimicrobium]|uniref:TfoX/Sxy family protein n=1 Tax=unclassified Lentimicrobium TaxID=2677434 RepID=UPI0015561EB0|nr:MULTISPECIES: TfoX/Sxy family protein [unclassified Lentimicrobium]NPD46330.1 TfoX/Sxy family protein [Lentimicrobium sp. S6]NPD85756.1 TfoX/Sxy family protein [Lentimicrobium sp. L6]